MSISFHVFLLTSGKCRRKFSPNIGNPAMNRGETDESTSENNDHLTTALFQFVLFRGEACFVLTVFEHKKLMAPRCFSTKCEVLNLKIFKSSLIM